VQQEVKSLATRVRGVGTSSRVEHAAAEEVLAWQDGVLQQGLEAVEAAISSSSSSSSSSTPLLSSSTVKQLMDITMLAFAFGHFSLACRLNLITSVGVRDEGEVERWRGLAVRLAELQIRAADS